MSWNNAVPFWVYEVANEHFIAQCNCCFYDEWFSGLSKVLPNHVQYGIRQQQNNYTDSQEKFHKELYKV